MLPLRTSEELIKQVNAETVILYAGRSTRNQPPPETLKLPEGAQVLRTDERGTVEVIMNGEKTEIRTVRYDQPPEVDPLLMRG